MEARGGMLRDLEDMLFRLIGTDKGAGRGADAASRTSAIAPPCMTCL